MIVELDYAWKFILFSLGIHLRHLRAFLRRVIHIFTSQIKLELLSFFPELSLPHHHLLHFLFLDIFCFIYFDDVLREIHPSD